MCNCENCNGHCDGGNCKCGNSCDCETNKSAENCGGDCKCGNSCDCESDNTVEGLNKKFHACPCNGG